MDIKHIEKLSELIKDTELSGRGIDSLSIEQLILYCVNMVGFEEVKYILESSTSEEWELKSSKLRD